MCFSIFTMCFFLLFVVCYCCYHYSVVVVVHYCRYCYGCSFCPSFLCFYFYTFTFYFLLIRKKENTEEEDIQHGDIINWLLANCGNSLAINANADIDGNGGSKENEEEEEVLINIENEETNAIPITSKMKAIMKTILKMQGTQQIKRKVEIHPFQNSLNGRKMICWKKILR